jgi:hypothetical protein
MEGIADVRRFTPAESKSCNANRREAMMVKKCRTTWDVVGWDAEVRIIESKITDDNVAVRSYEEAKMDAVEKLKCRISPYLARIGELEGDQFLKRGALPPMRAWQAEFRQKAVVTAKSKKRAAELVSESKYGFDNYWEECDGDWWYGLAQQEGVWFPHSDGNDPKAGEFQRCLTRDEAMEILREFARPYREVDPQELFPLVGNKRTDTGTTDDGVAYEITTEAWRFSGTPPEISVHFRISDGTGVIWMPPLVLEREIPKESVAWKDEGF